MKKLIINADDAGLSKEANEAIGKCFKSDVVTGTSVIACGASFNEAVEMLHSVGKAEVGVHLTLTGDFTPVSKDTGRIKTLLDETGKFNEGYQKFALRYFLGKINADEISYELASQIKKVRETGLKITHLDSHEHIHMLPRVLKTVLILADEFKVPYIRFSSERIGAIKKSFRVKDLLRYMCLKVFAPMAKRSIDSFNIKRNDFFLGHFHSGRISDDILCSMLDGLKDGVTELAVHPAQDVELETLLNGKWKSLAAEKDIQLSTFSRI